MEIIPRHIYEFNWRKSREGEGTTHLGMHASRQRYNMQKAFSKSRITEIIT
jgi:hypothetical protein